MTRASFNAIALGAAIIAVSSLADAQVYKCPDASGKTTYQSEPCDGGKALQGTSSKPSAQSDDPNEVFSGKRMMAVYTCAQLSEWVARISSSSAARRTSEEVARTEQFRRDCQPLGYRYPDSASSAEFNRAQSRRLQQEQIEAETAAVAAAQKARGEESSAQAIKRAQDKERRDAQRAVDRYNAQHR